MKPVPPPDGLSLVTNERVKLTASLLNTVAGFSITAGGIGPLIALSYGLNAPTIVSPLVLALVGAIWLGAGIGAHLLARWILGRLKL